MTDTVVLSIKLESGNFEMTLRQPIRANMTEADFKDAITTWLDLSIHAWRRGVTEMDAVLMETKSDG